MVISNSKINNIIGNNTTVMLPIRIFNPHKNRAYKTWGLIDTGATGCAIPADIAKMLGYKVTLGEQKKISTGNGNVVSYLHKMSIDFYHPDDPENKVIHTLDNVLIDCMPNLHMVLLGVEGFLSNFILCSSFFLP
jgi:hypothetical protein